MEDVIKENIHLVGKIVDKYEGDRQDLILEGVYGLLLAYNNYDPESKQRFDLYASWWIRAAIESFLTGDTIQEIAEKEKAKEDSQ